MTEDSREGGVQVEDPQQKALAGILRTLGYPPEEAQDSEVQKMFNEAQREAREARGEVPINLAAALQTQINYRDRHQSTPGPLGDNEVISVQGSAAISEAGSKALDEHAQNRARTLEIKLGDLGFTSETSRDTQAQDMLEQVQHQNQSRERNGRSPRNERQAVVGELAIRGRIIPAAPKVPTPRR